MSVPLNSGFPHGHFPGFNVGPGARAPSRARSLSTARARHGTAEQGSGPRQALDRRRRERSRDRDPSVTIRAEPGGVMESEDWLSALTMVHDRLDALERYSRMHATAIAQQDDEQKQTREAIRGFSNDFESYKKFITETHKRIDSHVKTNVNHIQSQIDAIVQVTVPNIDVLNQRVKNIEEALAQRQPSALGDS